MSEYLLGLFLINRFNTSRMLRTAMAGWTRIFFIESDHRPPLKQQSGQSFPYLAVAVKCASSVTNSGFLCYGACSTQPLFRPGARRRSRSECRTASGHRWSGTGSDTGACAPWLFDCPFGGQERLANTDSTIMQILENSTLGNFSRTLVAVAGRWRREGRNAEGRGGGAEEEERRKGRHGRRGVNLERNESLWCYQ